MNDTNRHCSTSDNVQVPTNFPTLPPQFSTLSLVSVDMEVSSDPKTPRLPIKLPNLLADTNSIEDVANNS